MIWGDLFQIVTSISQKQELEVFTYPDGETTSLFSYSKWKQDDNISVIDTNTNKTIHYRYDKSELGINFFIEEGHDYQIVVNQ